MSDEISARAGFQQYARQSKHLYFMSDRSGSCFYVNPAWLEFTGSTFDECCGHGWERQIHPKDLQHALRPFEFALETGNQVQFEYRLLHHSNGYAWINEFGWPLSTEARDFDCYIGQGGILDGPGLRSLGDGVIHLTPREREIMTFIAQGKTSSEVATILQVSARTVDEHVAAAIEKTGTANRIQAVVEVLRRGEIIV